MEFKKTIKYEVQDLVSYSIYAARKELIIIPVIFSMFLYLYNSKGLSQFNWLIFTISFVSTTIVLFLILYGLTIHRTKKSYNTIRPLQAPNETILDESGIHRSNEYGNSNFKWEDIYKADKTKKAVYIYIFKKQVVIIPKRLITADEEDIIKSLLKRHLPANKVKL